MKNLPFAMRLARSTLDPGNPVGATMKPFYLETASLDPEKSGNPLSNLKFSVSYGDPQPVQVIAKRSLGAVALKYRINGGAVRTATTSEASGGERYGSGGDVYYRLMRGTVTRTNVGDKVEVWFEDADNPAGKSDSFTYTAMAESGRRVLVVAAEDYTGISPAYKRGPLYLSYYLDALAANGYAADVYDVDANGRKAPSPLGVLGHYDAVVWYTGDDVITRDPGMVPGTASRLANDEMLAMRQYLDEGGRLLFTGKNAGLQYADGYEFDLERGLHATPTRRPTAAKRCRTTSCSTTWARTSTTTTPARRRTASSTTSWASPIRSAASHGRSADRAPTTRTTAPRSSRPAGSCPRRPTRSSKAGPPRSTSGRADHLIRIRARTTRTRRSRTSPTSG